MPPADNTDLGQFVRGRRTPAGRPAMPPPKAPAASPAETPPPLEAAPAAPVPATTQAALVPVPPLPAKAEPLPAIPQVVPVARHPAYVPLPSPAQLRGRLLELADSARRESGTWISYGPKITRLLQLRLNRQVKADHQLPGGRSLHKTQYFQVGFELMPRGKDGAPDVAAIAALTREWCQANRNPGPPQVDGSRVMMSTWDELRTLSDDLKDITPKVFLWEVHCALLERLLNQLTQPPA